MKRSPDTALLGLFSMFALGFALSLLVAVSNPGVAEIMTYVALLHGCFATCCFGGLIYQASTR